jgi:hypothetical protein
VGWVKTLLILFLTTCCLGGEFYLAKYEFIERENAFDYWTVKYADKNLGRIDLRPNPNEGYAFAEYSELIDDPDFIYLGNSEDALIPDVGDVLGVTFPPHTKVRGMIYYILTTLNNDKVCPPIMPDKDMNLKIKVGKKLIKQKKIRPEIDPEWVNIRKQTQKNYRKMYKRDKTHARKWLMTRKEKYKVADTDQFIPDDLPKVKPLPHSTILIETFDQADSPTLGPVLTWEEVVYTGGVATVSNQLVSIASYGNQNLTAPTNIISSSDHYAKITSISETESSYTLLILRWNGGTAQTIYYALLVIEGSTWLGFYKFTDAFYEIATDTITAPSYPFDLKFTVDGTTLTAYIDDVEVSSTTDTQLTGTRVGVGSGDNVSGLPELTMDNFETGGILDAATVLTPLIYNSTISNATIG